MKKLLLAIYLTLMVSTLNGETVKSENIKWIKLEDYCGKDIENMDSGIVYQEINGKNYKCGEIINGEKEGKWIYYYNNGKKREEGNYRDGNPEGKCISWYDNGQKQEEGNYLNGKEEGKWIEYYENGKKKSEEIYKDGKKEEGIYWNEKGGVIGTRTTNSTGNTIIKLLEYNEKIMENVDKGTVYQEIKGKLYKCGEIKNGNPEGKWIKYYENGQKEYDITIREGKPEGKWTTWYENGQKKEEIIYKDNNFINWAYWKKNGERVDVLKTTSTGEKIIRLIDENTLDKDIKEDKIEEINFVLLCIASKMKNGIVYQEKKGKLYKYGEMKSSKQGGKWIEYNENGGKEFEIVYEDGKRVKLIEYYENGKKKSEVFYKNDEEIKRIEYDEKGNRIEE